MGLMIGQICGDDNTIAGTVTALPSVATMATVTPAASSTKAPNVASPEAPRVFIVWPQAFY